MKKVRSVVMLVFLFFLGVLLLGGGTRQAAAAVEEKPGAATKEGGNGGKEVTQEEDLPGNQEACQLEEKAEFECPSTFGPIITDTAIPMEKGQFAIQPTYGLSFVTNSLNKNWRRVSAGGNFGTFSMEHKITMGLWDNLEGFVVIPFQVNWAGSVDEPGPHGERNATQGGLADINLTFKYCLLKETETRPAISALFATDFPTGRYRNLNPSLLGVDAMGGGAYVFTTGLNMSKYWKPFIFYANVWYSMQTAYSDDESRVYPRDFVTVNLAAEYLLTKKWVALLELTSFWDGGRLFGHKANTSPGALVSVLPGIEYMATDKFSLALGVNVDLAGKNTDATVTPMFSMVYAF